MQFGSKFCFKTGLLQFIFAFLLCSAALQAEAATISGNVHNEDGDPLANICINALAAPCGEWVNGAVSDNSGNYSIELPAGTYYLSTDVRCGDTDTFYADASWTAEGMVSTCDLAGAVTVAEDDAEQGKNFILTLGGSIAGKIKDSSGTGLDGICVNVFDHPCGTWVGGNVSDEDGNFNIILPPGDYYIGTDVACGSGTAQTSLINSYWNNTGGSYRCDEADVITVTREHVNNIGDMFLNEGGTISGTIFHSDGITPVTGFHDLGVTIFVIGEDNMDWQWAGWAPINIEDGTYHSPGLPPGTYFLETYNNSRMFRDECWAEPLSTEECANATPVEVEAGQAVSGKDFQLELCPDRESIFDDFESSYIDQNKWTKGEKVREIADGKLVLGIKDKADPHGNKNRLLFAKPNEINAIEAEVTVIANDTSNPDQIKVGAMIDGFFYQSSAAPVYAYVAISRGEDGSLVGACRVVQGYDTVFYQYFSTSLQTDHPYKMKIQYDPGTNRFTFTLDHESLTYSGAARTGPSAVEKKSLTVGIWGPADAGTGTIKAAFDNVFINNAGTPYDDFQSDFINAGKWELFERTREIREHKLVMSKRTYDSEINNIEILNHRVFDSHYFGAEIALKSNSWVAPGKSGRAGIGGYFYNVQHNGDYNGYEGDVYAGAGLLLFDDNVLKAGYKIKKCLNPDCSEFDDTKGFFNTTVALDETHNFSISMEGNSLIFMCDSERIETDITTPAYPPSSQNWMLLIRADGDGDSEDTFIKANFDTIRTVPPHACLSGCDRDGDGDVDGKDLASAIRVIEGMADKIAEKIAGSFGCAGR